MPEFIFALSGLCLSALLRLPKIPNGFYRTLNIRDFADIQSKAALDKLLDNKTINNSLHASLYELR